MARRALLLLLSCGLLGQAACRSRSKADLAEQRSWMATHCFAVEPKSPRAKFCQRCTISDQEFTKMSARGEDNLPAFIKDLGGINALSAGVDVCDDN